MNEPIARRSGDADLIALRVEVDNIKAQLAEHIRLQEIQMKSLEDKFDAFSDKVFKKFEEVTKALQNRLPIWATMLISLLVGLVGYFVK